MIIPPSAKSPSPNFIPSPPSLPSPLFSSYQPSLLPSPSTTPLLFSPSAFYSSFSFLSSYFSLPSPSPSPFLSNATDLSDLHHHYRSRRNHRKIRESGLHESYRGTQRGQNRVADDGPWHGSSRSVGVGWWLLMLSRWLALQGTTVDDHRSGKSCPTDGRPRIIGGHAAAQRPLASPVEQVDRKDGAPHRTT